MKLYNVYIYIFFEIEINYTIFGYIHGINYIDIYLFFIVFLENNENHIQIIGIIYYTLKFITIMII